MKKVTEEFPDGQYDDKNEQTAENKNEGVIKRYITLNENETNRYALKKVIEE